MYWPDLKMPMLMSGSSTRFCRRTNSTRNTAPATSGPQTNGLVSAKLLASENPSSKPPKPSADSMNDSVSNRSLRLPSPPRTSSAVATPRRMARMISIPPASSSTKKLRHPNEKLKAPPTVGPMFGAKPMAMPAMPMAVARRPSGKRVMAIVCMSGSRSPVDTAWQMRPASSTAKFEARQSARAPTRKNARAMNTCWRTEKRRERNVATGTVMPSTSM